MIIPQISQLPLQEPMYFNGVMAPVWIRFFERLSNLRNDADLIQLIELAQRVAELPSQATQAQQGFNLHTLLLELKNLPVQVPCANDVAEITPVTITTTSHEGDLPLDQSASQAQLGFDFYSFQKEVRIFMTQISERVTDLEDQVALLNNTITDVLSALSTLNTKHDDLANRVAALENA